MKKLFISIITITMCFILTGCKEKTNVVGKTDGDAKQQEQSNVNSLGIGKYKVEKNGNSILVVTNDGSAISTTEYKFTNNTLTNATLTQKYSSSAIAQTIYDTMKNEPTIINQYADMNISGDTIIMNIKNEILSVYNGMDQNTVYDLMYQTYSMYMGN